jgi:hypothetical protein
MKLPRLLPFKSKPEPQPQEEIKSNQAENAPPAQTLANGMVNISDVIVPLLLKLISII